MIEYIGSFKGGKHTLLQNVTARRTRACISSFSVTELRLRNPFVVAFWSFAFPGCGYLTQGRYIKGMLFILWEMFVNTRAHINLAIMYSLLGQFDMSKEVIDTRWLLAYVPVYVYVIWHAYTETIDMNKLCVLADREDVPLTPFAIKTLDINFLDKRHPWLSAIWSAFTPGLGYLYVHKVLLGLFFIAWTVNFVYFSHSLEATHLFMVGHFEQAKSVLNMEWLLFLPSIYGFVIYDSYSSCVELNKLFEKEQRYFLRKNYQNANFSITT